MAFLNFMLFTVVTGACIHAAGRNCAIVQSKLGRTCSPAACANQNTSCPLIPDVICASDECGCRIAFDAVINPSGQEQRRDVTDLCQATAEIKEASDLIEGLLAGDAEKCDLVASDPKILFRVFKGLNLLTAYPLKMWIWSLNNTFLESSNDHTPAMERRRNFLQSELAALEERIRRRELDDVRNCTAVNRLGDVSGNIYEDVAQEDFQRKKDVINQWSKKQEKVKILDESVSMRTLIKSARMASRKYAVDNQGRIFGSQLPIYGNILYTFIPMGDMLYVQDEKPYADEMKISDPGNVYKIYFELGNHLRYIVLDETIARRELKRSNFRFALRPVSAVNARVRFNLRSFDPLMRKTGIMDEQSILRFMSFALQTAALGMDLYNSIAGQSPTTLACLAAYVQDWNIADDLTEFLF